MGKGRGVSSYTHTQQQRDAYANQLNPNNASYQAVMDHNSNLYNPNSAEHKSDLNNHSEQLNHNNSKYQGK